MKSDWPTKPERPEFADEPAGKGNARGGIQALDAALVVLRTMASCCGPVSLTDLARTADMPTSKVHRYLASFIHAGLVTQRERSGHYDLGPVAREMGLSALSRTSFVNDTADGLEKLSRQTDLTALLSVWSSAGPIIVRWERAENFTVTSLGLGTALPLLTSATGRVFLSFLPDRMTAKLLGKEMARARDAGLAWPDLKPDMEDIANLMSGIRNARMADIDGRFIPGLRALAAPVTNWQGHAEVVVTLIGSYQDILSPESPARMHLDNFVRSQSIPSQSN